MQDTTEDRIHSGSWKQRVREAATGLNPMQREALERGMEDLATATLIWDTDRMIEAVRDLDQVVAGTGLKAILALGLPGEAILQEG